MREAVHPHSAVPIAAALCGMALRFAVGRPANAGRVNELEAAIAALDGVLERIQPLDERDMAAYAAVLEAYRQPKDAPTRAVAIETALGTAMRVPTAICAACADALRTVEPLVGCVGRNLIADLDTGVELLHAAARSARLMVMMNATEVADAATGLAALHEADSLVGEIAERHARLCACAERSIERR